MVNRLLKIPLEAKDYIDELNTIKYIAVANGYSSAVIDKIVARQKRNIYKNRSINKTHNSDTKYIPTEFTNLLPNTIKNVLKKNGFAVSFKTSNCILNALRPVTNRLVENCSGIYKIECEDCNNFYVGQTGREFLDRYRDCLLYTSRCV